MKNQRASWAVSIAISILLSSQVASTSSPTSLIKDVCRSREFDNIDYKFCVETLASEPRVVLASNLMSISIAIIEAGISNATKTQSYVQKLLKNSKLKPDSRYVLQQCDTAYNYSCVSFGSALIEVKEKLYGIGTHDLEVSVADGILGHHKALGSKKIKDGVISKGNDFMVVFGEVAARALDRLITH